MPKLRALLAAAAIALTTSSCSLLDAGLEQATGAAEISLQKPGSLDGVPLLPTVEGVDPVVQEQPPGISMIVGSYGRNNVPLLTLQAYAGAPAAVGVAATAYDTAIGGDEVGASRCKQQSKQTATCWRSQSNLLVAVSTIDGRPLEELATVVDEAWTSVRA